MTESDKNIANPFVPELDLFSKPEEQTQKQYIRNALITRLSQKVTEAHMKYISEVNKYQEMMRLIEAYSEAGKD
jgi:hypothetical protein